MLVEPCRRPLTRLLPRQQEAPMCPYPHRHLVLSLRCPTYGQVGWPYCPHLLARDSSDCPAQTATPACGGSPLDATPGARCCSVFENSETTHKTPGQSTRFKTWWRSIPARTLPDTAMNQETNAVNKKNDQNDQIECQPQLRYFWQGFECGWHPLLQSRQSRRKTTSRSQEMLGGG